jgi:retron-type reverse transcriptase
MAPKAPRYKSPFGGTRVKTYRNLWPQLCSFENLWLAWRRARRGKSTRVQVIRFEAELEENLLALQAALEDDTYQPGAYTNFWTHEGKRRKISAAPFPDRVVHHALCKVLEPLYERRFIHDSYACRIGKGTHRALDRCTYFARRYPFVLQCDVARFFPSVDHEVLRGILGRALRDERTLGLIDRILRNGLGILDEQALQVWFPGDDLLAPLRPRGLPIGNLTSQFWANVYLNELDQYVKRELKVDGYVRYADDFLLFGERKAGLWEQRARVIQFLAGLRLSPNHHSFQVFPVRAGIDFLGFRVYPDHRRLLPRTVRLARQRMRRLSRLYSAGEVQAARVSASVLGWVAHASHGDTWGLRRSVLKEFQGKRTAHARVTHLRKNRRNARLADGPHREVPQVPPLPNGPAPGRGGVWVPDFDYARDQMRRPGGAH